MNAHRKALSALALPVLLAPALAGAQTTESLRAQVPFTFQAAGKELPPGTYDVNLEGGRPYLALRSVDGRKGIFLMTVPTEPKKGMPPRPELVFVNAGGTYALADVFDPLEGVGVEVMRPKHAGEETRRTEVPLQRLDGARAAL